MVYAPFQTRQFNTHAPAEDLAELRYSWTAWNSGRLCIAVSRGSIEALRPWRKYTSCIMVTTDASTRAVFEGFVARVRISEPVAHKPLGAKSSLLSAKGFSARARTAACTDSHRQHVYGLLYKSQLAPGLCANRQRISCYGRIVTSSPSEQRTSPVS